MTDSAPLTPPDAVGGEPQYITCPRCRYRDRRRMHYCAHCGADLGGALQQQTRAPWRRLSADMTADEVRAVLGDPLSVEVNSALGQIHWFYSAFKMSGPRVQFDGAGERVTFWREPPSV